GKGIEVDGLLLENTLEIKRFLKAVKRNEMKHKRKEEFDRDDFVPADYLSDLEKYKVKIVSGI
ncbi:MAG: acyl-CoA thioesterase, partial [Kordia sp.]